MNLQDINWDFNEAGNWPTPIKALAILLASVMVMGAWVYFDTLDQMDNLEKTEKKEIVLNI